MPSKTSSTAAVSFVVCLAACGAEPLDEAVTAQAKPLLVGDRNAAKPFPPACPAPPDPCGPPPGPPPPPAPPPVPDCRPHFNPDGTLKPFPKACPAPAP